MTNLIPNSRCHDLVFHQSGKIDISARVAHAIGLEPGDVIDLIELNGEWLLGVKLRHGEFVGRHVGTVYATSRNGRGTLRTYIKAITQLVLASSGMQGRVRCPCGEVVSVNGRNYITIIYRISL